MHALTYLKLVSAWFPGADSAEFPTSKPFFWTRVPLTWFVAAHVNKQTYCLLGCSNGTYGGLLEPAKQLDIRWTSTHTIVALQAGHVSFTLDFFSPVSINDYVRQSIPYSYLTISAQNTKREDTVDIFTAIDQTWTSQNITEASFTQTKSSQFFKISGKNSIPLTEKNDMATYGSVVLAASSKICKISHQTGPAEEIFKQISNSGSLKSNPSSQYQSGNLVALSYSIPDCSKPAPVTFAVGFERSPTIMWLNKPQAAYYQSKLNSTSEVVDYFFADHPAAQHESETLDTEVRRLGTTLSENYADILEAHVAQV